MAQSHELGSRSEQIAAEYLAARGYEILARNYRVGHREVDLIVARGGLVAFVEVKARAGPAYGHPLDAITWAKRREIERVARTWIAGHGKAGNVYRFDAVAVLWYGQRSVVEHVPDAWRIVK